MKTLFRFIILTGILASLTACPPCEVDEKICPPDCPPEDTTDYPLEKILEFRYFTPTTDQNSIGSVGEVKKYKNILIYNGFPPYIDKIFRIFFFDTNTGKRLKVFKTGYNGLGDMEIIDKYLITSGLDGGFIFDLDNLSLVKKLNNKFYVYLAQFDNSVYLTALYGPSVQYPDSTSLIKLHIPSLETEKILTITRKEYGGFSSLNTVSFEVLENGDTMMYGTYEAQYKKLYSYNLTKGGFVWETRAKGGDFYSSHPLYDDKYIFITNYLGAEAYDKSTGKLVWRTPLTHDGNWFRGNEPLLLNGRLYLLADNKKIFCLDSKDGSIIWENDKAGGGLGGISYYKDMIYHVNEGNQLIIVDMNTGEELLRIDSPHRNVNPDNVFARFEIMPPYIDSTAGVFYQPDRHQIICFKLWEK